MPDIGNTYTQDIDEYFTSPLMQYKINDKIKISGKLSAAKNLKKFTSYSEYKTNIDNANNWSVKKNENLNSKQNFLNSSIQISHENKNKIAGLLRFQFFVKSKKNNYSDISTNAINDTLSEYISNLNLAYGIDYSFTKKINKNKIFNLNSFLSYSPEVVINDLYSRRLLKYFSPIDSSIYFNQKTNIAIKKYNASFSFLEKSNNRLFKYGMKINGEFNKGFNKTFGAKENRNHENLNLIDQISNGTLFMNNFLISFGYLSNIDKKKSLKVSFDGGLSQNNLNSINDSKNINLVYNFTTSLVLKKRAFSSRELSFLSSSQMPNLTIFYFNRLLGGNSSISISPSSLKPIAFEEINLSYSKSKLQSNSSFFTNIFLRKYRSDYINAYRFTKYISESYPNLINDKLSAGLNINAKTFVFPLHSTIIVSSSVQIEKFKTVINEILALESNINFNYSLNYITNFKLPINTELIFNESFNSGKQIRDEVNLKYDNSFFTFQDKIRITIKKKYFVGLQYRLIKFKDQKSINLGDVFSTFNLSKNLSIDLKLFNAFNLKQSVKINNDSNNFTVQSYSLVNRYLLFLVNYSF